MDRPPIASRRWPLRHEPRRKRQGIDARIAQDVPFVGMVGQTLPNPVTAILEAPDRTDLVASLVVLDDAFSDTLDVGGITVEIADQRPHRFQRMIEDGAVIGCSHACLQEMMAYVSAAHIHGYLVRPASPTPPDFRMRNDMA